MRLKKLLAAWLLAVALPASAADVAFTARLQSYTSTPASSYLMAVLTNCAPGNIPRVISTGVKAIDRQRFDPDATGLISATITPKGDITCGSQIGLTQYRLEIWEKQYGQPDRRVWYATYDIASAFDLSTAVPATPVNTSANPQWLDLPLIATPNGPAPNFARIFGSSSSNLQACLLSDLSNCAPSGGGGGFYQTFMNAASLLTQRARANFFNGITCADNAVPSPARTDCQIDTTSGFSPSWAGNHTFNGQINIAGAFKINGAAPQGKIPIGDGTNYVPGDPLVQGTQAEGSTSAANPINVGGYDTAGTPALHGAKVVNGTPAGSEYGIVTRNISSGTQTVSGTVTANAGTNLNTSALALDSTLTGGTQKTKIVDSGGTNVATVSAAGAVKVDGSAVTQPVSGTVTTTPPANASTNIAQVNGATVSTAASGVQKVGVTGNAGAAMDAAGQNATAPANELLIGAQFNTTPTTISTGNVSPLQVDSSGNLKVNIQSGGGSGGTASSFAAAFPASGTAIGVKNGANMTNLTADGSNNLNVNCAAGCSAAGDQATGSTPLGSNGAVITLPLTGDNKATFQLQSAGTGVYTVTPQCSFDGGTLYNVNGYIQDPISGALALTATIASAQATTDYPILCPQGASHAQMKVTAYTSGSANWVARATVNSGPNLAFGNVSTSAPSPSNGTVNPLSLTTAGALRTDSSATTQPVSGTVTANAGTNLNTSALALDATLTGGTQKTKIVDTGGTNVASVSAAGAVKVDGSAVTQPVSGTVTANAGTNLNTSALALDASVTGLEVSQASTTSGQKGALVQGAVTTAAPTYTTAQTSPLSLNTAGGLRVDGSGVTQPVSGTVTANAGTNLNTSALALDTSVNGVIVSQGSTTSGQKGALVQGAVTTAAPTYTTAQSSPLSLTTAGALRTDSSAVTQPVSGTVTTTPPANASTNVAQFGGTNVSTGTGAGGAGIPRVTISNDSSLAANQSVNLNQVGGAAITLGQKTSANSTPVVLPSDQTVTVQGASSDNSANSSTKQPTLPAVANASAQTRTEGNQVPLSVDLTGALRITGAANGVQQVNNSSGSAANVGYNSGSLPVPVNDPATVQMANMLVALLSNHRITGSFGRPITSTGDALDVNVKSNVSGCAGVSPLATNTTPFNISTATTVLLIPKSSSDWSYICFAEVIVGGADNVALIYGTSSSTPCDTGATGVSGGATAATGWNFAANGGKTSGDGMGVIYRIPPGKDVCLQTSAAVQASGSFTWTQQ